MARGKRTRRPCVVAVTKLATLTFILVTAFSYGFEADSETVCLVKIKEDKCGQAILQRKYKPYAVLYAGVQEDTCAAHGFTLEDGKTELRVPVLGQVKIELFRRGATLPLLKRALIRAGLVAVQ
mmetsp:Transcript_47868/g.86363  ORF Transcript_47868/g.86363 Transcript_47868/m.86363 type:complete len:124 (+) Transcript_47868:20-391(+)